MEPQEFYDYLINQGRTHEDAVREARHLPGGANWNPTSQLDRTLSYYGGLYAQDSADMALDRLTGEGRVPPAPGFGLNNYGMGYGDGGGAEYTPGGALDRADASGGANEAAIAQSEAQGWKLDNDGYWTDSSGSHVGVDAPSGGLTDSQRWAAYTNMGQGVGRGVAGLINLFRGSPDHLIDAYRKLSNAYNNLEDPTILKQIWNHPVLQQIARYRPEMVTGFHETMADFEGYEGDPVLRAQEDAALATITERARRGDPEMQRLRSREAAAAVGSALARAGGTAQEQAARRGMPGMTVPGMAQAGAQYAGRVGTANVMASRKSQEGAERTALQGAMGIRKGRESQGQMAANLRNQFRNAMSNRQLSVSMANQKSRQAAEDKNQALAQSLHQQNLLFQHQCQHEDSYDHRVYLSLLSCCLLLF